MIQALVYLFAYFATGALWWACLHWATVDRGRDSLYAAVQHDRVEAASWFLVWPVLFAVWVWHSVLPR